MNIKIIKSEQDHGAALARLSALMSASPSAGSEEENELELLALVIEDYERQVVPPVYPDPIEAILFRMDQMQLGRKDLIPYIGSASKVSEVLSRKRPLSLAMIRRLHQGLDIPADVLINDIATAGDLSDDEPAIDFSRFPLKEMADRGCFGVIKQGIKDIKDYAEDLMRPLMQEVMPAGMPGALLRAPLHRRGERQADESALLAWRMCVLRQARMKKMTREYKPGTVTAEWMRDVARLSAFAEGPRLVDEHLSRSGITLVIEPHFAKTFLDGAAMLDGTRAIVALTLRHDRLDNFWFALMHELAHVALHLNEQSPVFMDDLDGNDSEALERQADDMASEALIPKQVWEHAAVRKSQSTADAIDLADQLSISPAIVAGRLRHETHNFRLLPHLLGKSGLAHRAQ